MEEAIRLQDLKKSVNRYQKSIDDTKTRSDLAVARGVWLMPSRMVINTESQDMKLGVNNDVNLGTKKASLRLMDGGPPKTNPPNSHPSNPIHKKAIQAQGLAKKKPPRTSTPQPKDTDTQTDTPAPHPHSQTDSIDPHHVNKALIAVGALALAGFVVWMR